MLFIKGNSRLNQGSSCNAGTTATEAEACKIEKYRELIDNGYIFRPVALEGVAVNRSSFSDRKDRGRTF